MTDQPIASPSRASGAVTEDDLALYPGLYRATQPDGDPVTFGQIVQARRIPARRRDDEMIAVELERRLTERFAAAHGGVLKTYFCRNLSAGGVLSGQYEVLSVLNSDEPEIVALADECERIVREARRWFGRDTGPSGQNWQLEEAADLVYSALARVLRCADVWADPASTAEDRRRCLQTARAAVTATDQRVQVFFQRHLRFFYFAGMVAGAVPVLGLCVLLGWLIDANWNQQVSAPSFLASTLFGVLGAITSVVQRMSTGRLVLDPYALRRQHYVLGAVRPFVGAVFAAVVQFALITGLFATQSDPRGTGSSFAFFALTGFVSGFSERFATDMVERAGRILSGSADTEGSPQQAAPGAAGAGDN